MENNTSNGGFYMLIEDLTEESTEASTPLKEETEKNKESYDFYPDSSF